MFLFWMCAQYYSKILRRFVLKISLTPLTDSDATRSALYYGENSANQVLFRQILCLAIRAAAEMCARQKRKREESCYILSHKKCVNIFMSSYLPLLIQEIIYGLSPYFPLFSLQEQNSVCVQRKKTDQRLTAYMKNVRTGKLSRVQKKNILRKRKIHLSGLQALRRFLLIKSAEQSNVRHVHSFSILVLWRTLRVHKPSLTARQHFTRVKSQLMLFLFERTFAYF